MELFSTLKQQGAEQLELLGRIATALEGIQNSLRNKQSSGTTSVEMQRDDITTVVTCNCGLPAIQFRASDKARKYPGKLFWRCAAENNCGFVQRV